MKSSTILLSMLFFACCTSPNQHTLSVENKSQFAIDSVIIKSREMTLFFQSIPPGENWRKDYVIEKEYTSEGAFHATIYFRDTTVICPSFGYYSNTKDIKDNINLVIDSNLVVRENPHMN